MTLIVTVNGPETIWMCADRRLSMAGRRPRDDARKLMILETRDGTALLGYAGLGATALGTEPADWMSAVLRNRNLTLEESLNVLAGAMRQQFPRHMIQMPVAGGPAHNLLIPAIFDDEVRFYSIDLVFAPDRRQYGFRYTRHVVDKSIRTNRVRTPRISVGGSGALHLMKRGKRWMRDLIRLVRAADQQKVPLQTAADHLAELNYSVHRADRLVGPRCIVAWRNRKAGIHKGGGGHQYYNGAERDPNSPALPTIANGMDVAALVGAMMPHLMKSFERMRAGEPFVGPDTDELNAELARLPEHPDEQLR